MLNPVGLLVAHWNDSTAASLSFDRLLQWLTSVRVLSSILKGPLTAWLATWKENVRKMEALKKTRPIDHNTVLKTLLQNAVKEIRSLIASRN